ncbi:hypothetical protein [Malaciobacter mytili]|uniref:hypothetical protein n=1 Tax=Malaciobacter mytili TaxID=603050 RepID=UPI00100BF6AC|nr:hypothetical protein [Malaciobacter mytili]
MDILNLLIISLILLLLYISIRKTILNNYKLEEIKNSKIRTHKLVFNNRQILVYSLTSPSNAANRSIGANKNFKEKKLKNPNYKPFDFRYEEYKLAFLNS